MPTYRIHLCGELLLIYIGKIECKAWKIKKKYLNEVARWITTAPWLSQINKIYSYSNILCFCLPKSLKFFRLPPRGRFRNWNPLLYFHWPPYFLPYWLPYFLLSPFLDPSCFPNHLFSPHAVWRMWVHNWQAYHTEIIEFVTQYRE